MIIYTVKHTKNPYSICIAFVEKQSADDYANACNFHGAQRIPASIIKYYVEELEVVEG